MSKANLLKELFEKDYVTKTVELTQNLKVVLRSLDSEQQFLLEEDVKSLASEEAKLNQRQFIQRYGIHKLSYALMSYGDLKFSDPKETLKFFDKKSLSLIQKLLQEQESLESDLKEALNIKDIGETFFPEGKSPEGSKQKSTE